MAGPGGKEVGRLSVKVVPDTDGFTAKVKAVAEKAEAEDVDIDLDLDTKKAEAKLKELTKTRTVKIKIDLDTKSARAKLDRLVKERTAKINVDADAKAASARIKQVARDRTAKLQIRFTGQEAVERVQELAKDKVQRVKIDLDDRNARTKLRVLDRDAKIIADIDIDKNNIAQIERWVRSLGPEFEKDGNDLAEGFRRAAVERVRRDLLKINQDYNRAAQQAETERLRRFARQVREAQRRRAAEQARIDRESAARRRRVQQQINRLQRAEAQRMERIFKESARRLQKQLRDLGSDFPDRIPIEVAIDPRRRMEAFRAELARLERERLNIEVNLRGVRGVAARIAMLARDRRMEIKADIDRSTFGATGYFIGKVFQSIGSVAIGAIGGVARGLAIISSGLGRMGNIGQKVFGGIANASQQATGTMGKLVSAITTVAVVGLGLTLVVGVIYAIVNALGALIVAAIGAVAAIGSVILGAAGLLALPAIFAGIGVAIISLSDDNSKLKKQFSELKNQMVETFSKVGSPMINFFSDSLEKMNKSLQKGTPLYRQLRTGFEESTKALIPLRSGLADMATNTLTGLNRALNVLNSSGVMHTFSNSIGNLGSVLGNFAVSLAAHAPGIASSFDVLVSGLDRIGVSLGNWLGKFATDAPDTINAFSDAISRMLDTFASDSDVFTQAATALGDAIDQATPGLHDITRAFAQMSPQIFSALATGINELGDSLNPQTIANLASLTSALINITALLADLGIKLSAGFGSQIRNISDMWDKFTGKLSSQIDISKQEFASLLKQESTTRSKIAVGLNQLRSSASRSMEGTGKILVDYAAKAVEQMAKVDGEAGQHAQQMAARLQSLANDWNKAGGKVGEGWYDAWNQLGQSIDKGGNAALKKMYSQMSQALGVSEEFRNKLKANLVAALEEAGVQVGPALMAQIDQALGLITRSTDTQSKQAVENIRKNFSRLPGIIQTAMNEAKTPEQLQQKLAAVQKVMETMTPQIANAFAKLPTEMQQTLGKSTAAFESWTGMETFRQKVATSVGQAVTEFGRLIPAINSVSGRLNGLGVNAATAGAGLNGFNARVNWTNWILNQVGAQAAWAGWQMGQFASNSQRAAVATQSMNSAANGLNGALQGAGTAAAGTSSQILGLSADASQAGARFNQFSMRIAQSMARAREAVSVGVVHILSTLRRLPGMAASYGRLSGFISSISASMAIAEDTVAGAVQSMLAQLSRLNTTVTTTININRNETTRRKTIVEPPQTGRNMPFMDVHAPVPVGIDIGETPRRFDVRAASASQQSVNWGRTAVRVIEDSRSSDNRGVVKNYEFNIEAAPNVPTEKQIIKQQRKADALYGD